MKEQLEKSFNLLKDYCEKEHFKGWDPYDGLNSIVFQSLPFSNKRLSQLIWIQTFKRSPINLRKIMRVEKEVNPQGLALFLSGYCNLYSIEQKEEYLENIRFLIEELYQAESFAWNGSCWGYNFDWRARAFFQPKYSPTVVATTFVGYALLDAYEILGDEKLKLKSRSICDFILSDLNRSYDDVENFAFSYSPLDKTQVYNASLLGSRMLSRMYSLTREEELVVEAKKSVQYCCNDQQSDGSWTYGTKIYHQWKDSFHTGYNLECISEYQKYSGDESFSRNIDVGLKYYLENYFTTEGIAKYYDNQTYPVDINCISQLIVTLYRLNSLSENLNFVEKILGWGAKHMQDKRYYYYQIRKGFSVKTPYMRWAQAWIFNALTFYLRSLEHGEKKN